MRLDVPAITIDGRSLAPDLTKALVQFRLEESIHLPDRFTLHFDDPHFSILDSDVLRIGARVAIGMQVDREPIEMSAGEIVALAVEIGRTGRHELVITGYDLTHRLARQTRRRTFQSMSDADIATRIADEHGLRNRIRLPGGGVRHDYLLQGNESDLAFLRRLAARNGADVWIHEDTLHVEPRTGGTAGTPVTLTWGRDLTQFSVRLSAAQLFDEVVVRAWDSERKEAIVAQSTGPEPTGALAEIAAQARAAFGQTSRTSTWIEVPHPGVAARLADSLQTRALAEAVIVRGEAHGNPMLGAGTTIRLEGVGQRLAADYRVTEVTHVYAPEQAFRSRFICGGLEGQGLADLIAGAGAAGAAVATGLGAALSGPSAPGGLVVGEVTDTSDPAGLGRVRVKLPSLDDAAESNWARVVLPGAGDGTGLAWVPAINDEVLVGFELGDTTRPVVLGGMWSQVGQPPDSVVGPGHETTRRGLVTASEHELVLDDDAGSIRLSVGGADAELLLSGTGSTLHGDRELTIRAQRITVAADQVLTLKGARVEISASGDVTVSGQPIKLN